MIKNVIISSLLFITVILGVLVHRQYEVIGKFNDITDKQEFNENMMYGLMDIMRIYRQQLTEVQRKVADGSLRHTNNRRFFSR